MAKPKDPSPKRQPPVVPILDTRGNRQGRPRTEVDWPLVDRLCAILCTQEEIADVAGTSPTRLNTACLEYWGVSFAVYYRQQSANGKMSLRRAQVKNALKGNAQIQIWLGKQWLGQHDKAADTTIDPEEVAHKIRQAVRDMDNTIGGEPQNAEASN